MKISAYRTKFRIFLIWCFRFSKIIMQYDNEIPATRVVVTVIKPKIVIVIFKIIIIILTLKMRKIRTGRQWSHNSKQKNFRF